MKRNLRAYDSVLDTVGWTPLIRLNKVTTGLRTPVYGKAEFFNPGGSIKDRIGNAIIEDAEKRGDLKPGGVIVEATSGNTGVGLALAAALKGYRCVFTMPDKMSQEKVKLLRAFGSEVVITPTAVPPDHPDNYLMKAKSIVAKTPNAVLANQFYNDANPQAHYRTTGPEVWEQTEGRITHFVSAAGTGGTLSGVGRFLKEQNPDIKILAADPVGSIYAEYAWTKEVAEGAPYKVEGIGGDKIPSTLHFDYVDEFYKVADADSFQLARRLTREEGLFVGGSTGANVLVALNTARELDDPDALIVVVLCDTGERYLSKCYDDEWMKENQMLGEVSERVEVLLSGKPEATAKLITVEPRASVRQGLNLMSTYNVSQLPVVEEGDCIGSVSEASLMMLGISDPKALEQPVRELMDPPFPVIDYQTPVEEVTAILSRETPAVLVRVNGSLTGIITRYDLLHHYSGIR